MAESVCFLILNSLNVALPAPAPVLAEVMFSVVSAPKLNSLISMQPLYCESVVSPTIGVGPPVNLRNASNAMSRFPQ